MQPAAGLLAEPSAQSLAGRGPEQPAARPIRARNQVWLADTLDRLWEEHFWDVPRICPVRIRFGARWKWRLALIRWESATESSLIALNALFRDPIVPESLCEVTIAHEIVHYAHGFGSPLPRRASDPHADRVIERELAARGLGPKLALADAWVDRCWSAFYEWSTNRQPGVSLAT